MIRRKNSADVSPEPPTSKGTATLLVGRRPHAAPTQPSPVNTTKQSLPTTWVIIGIWIIAILAVGQVILPSPSADESSLLRKGTTNTENDRCQILYTSPPSELASLTEFDLKGCILSSIPTEIGLCTSLRKLDVSSNPMLKTLPKELGRCTNLEILFSSQNTGMSVLPTVLGSMSSITRLGWRSGSLAKLEAASVPPNVVHVILTNNQITELEEEDVFDRLQHVRKLMLSHNRIRSISNTGIAKLRELELLRLAGNQLTSIPANLWLLPKLTWLTISGNQGLNLPVIEQRVPSIPLHDVHSVGGTDSKLGAGASGSVTAQTWQGKDVAVKTIHGVTSDGKAEDELAMYGAVGSDSMQHRLVGCLALFRDGDRSGVVMERIPTGIDGQVLEDMALPPTIVEVTADRWVLNGVRVYNSVFIKNAIHDAVSALLYLHREVGIAHGDFYAHNIKVDNKSGHLYLLDLGASWATGPYAKRAEQLEVRAFGIFIKEMLDLQEDASTEEGGKVKNALISLAKSCMAASTYDRPSFVEIAGLLENLLPDL